MKGETPRETAERLAATFRELLHANDCIGYFQIEAPGHSAYALQVDATWSCLSIKPEPDGGERVRIRAKFNPDEPEKHEQLRRDLANTAGALHSMGLTLGTVSVGLLDLSDRVDDAIGAEHFGTRVGDV